ITWPRHCVVDTDGAGFIPAFNAKALEERVQLANIGADNDVPDYNPFYDPEFYKFMSERAPETIYVTGIALEYCVLATCLAAQAYSNKVIALEDYIQSAKADQANIAWHLLENSGVERRKGNPFA
ncbi:MAG: isochorismatase family protein, partial [Terriglobia bacterium]